MNRNSLDLELRIHPGTLSENYHPTFPIPRIQPPVELTKSGWGKLIDMIEDWLEWHGFGGVCPGVNKSNSGSPTDSNDDDNLTYYYDETTGEYVLLVRT